MECYPAALVLQRATWRTVNIRNLAELSGGLRPAHMGQYEGGMVGGKMSVYLHTVTQPPSGLRAVLWEPPRIAHLRTQLIICNL